MNTDQIIAALDRLAIPNQVTEDAARELERLQEEVRRMGRRIAALEDLLPDDFETDTQ